MICFLEEFAARLDQRMQIALYDADFVNALNEIWNNATSEVNSNTIQTNKMEKYLLHRRSTMIGLADLF